LPEHYVSFSLVKPKASVFGQNVNPFVFRQLGFKLFQKLCAYALVLNFWMDQEDYEFSIGVAEMVFLRLGPAKGQQSFLIEAYKGKIGLDGVAKLVPNVCFIEFSAGFSPSPGKRRAV
jgi:hypothetical protein